MLNISLLSIGLWVFPAQISPPLPTTPGPEVAWHVDAKFRQALDEPITASWKFAELRPALQQLATTRRVAIVLDRRIDPNQQIALDLHAVPLHEGLRKLAHGIGAGISIGDNFVYLGPPESARRLRTLIELRQPSRLESVGEKRLAELTKPRDFHWHDFERPAEILNRFCKPAQLQLTGEPLPHDVWAGQMLPHTDVVSALSVVLIQFDRTFDWGEPRSKGTVIAVRALKVGEPLSIERHYKPRGKSAAETVTAIRKQHPELDVAVAGTEIVVRGTAEDHDAVQDWFRPATIRKPSGSPPPIPVHKRLFTLKVEQVPLRAVLDELEKSDLQFTYDAAAFQQAGIDLNQPVTLDVQKKSASDFFKALFTNQPLDFTLDGLTIHLQLRK